MLIDSIFHDVFQIQMPILRWTLPVPLDFFFAKKFVSGLYK